MQANESIPYVVGVDLGGTNVRASVTDISGNLYGEGRTDSRAMDGVDATVAQIATAVADAVSTSGVDRSRILGIGMGVPGTVLPDEGIVAWAPNFRGWDGVQVGEPLRVATGLPVIMGNDANVAALGEYTFGAGVGSRCMVMFTLGTGIGSGLVIDGKSWIGVSGCAPEMGHQIILADGPRCGCGRSGCLEALAGRDPICFRAARKAHLGRSTLLLERSGHDLRYITPAMISEAAAEGDEIAVETLNETGYYIGLGVANAMNILNPDCFVIGGGIAGAGDLLLEPIRRTVEVNALYSAVKACRIVRAELGDDAGILGAAATALQRFGG